jgi:hypothetical protein
MCLEREHLLPLAAESFELAWTHFPQVNGSGCVRVLTNFYTAPVPVGREVRASRLSRMAFLCVRGVFESAGPRGTRAIAPRVIVSQDAGSQACLMNIQSAAPGEKDLHVRSFLARAMGARIFRISLACSPA